MHTYMHTYMHAYIHACMHTHIIHTYLVVQPGCRHCCNEELTAIRIRPRIGHTDGVFAIVFEVAVEFVFEVFAPDGRAARAVSVGIARLDHEVLDHAMEDDTIVVPAPRKKNTIIQMHIESK
jgi:hypothetical protein